MISLLIIVSFVDCVNSSIEFFFFFFLDKTRKFFTILDVVALIR